MGLSVLRYFLLNWILWGLCVFLLPAGCSSDGNASAEAQTRKDWLMRTPTPESEFAPTGIEGVIDNIVTALNETEQELGVKSVFMPKTMESFFEDANLGATRAFGELGLLGTVIAPPSSSGENDANPQQLQIDFFSSQLADGVLLYGIAPNSQEIFEQMNSAVTAGGVVVTFDTDRSESLRQFYVGTNNVEAGRTAGATMDSLIPAGTTGTVIVLGTNDSNWLDGYNRTHEARKVLEGEGHVVEVLESHWVDYDINITSISESISNANPPVVGCLGVFNISYACAEAVVALGLEGEIKVATFDAEPETLNYMNEGVIQATHTQRLYYMGYLVPYVSYAVYRLGVEKTRSLLRPLLIDDQRIDTGLDVIRADKMGEYDAFMDKLNAL